MALVTCYRLSRELRQRGKVIRIRIKITILIRTILKKEGEDNERKQMKIATGKVEDGD